MCINQGNEEEKHREIRQMHKIYSNAHCKIALIPELETMKRVFYEDPKVFTFVSIGSLLEAQWMRRIWTLEELIMSSKILFVGSGTHFWWHCISENDLPLFHHDLYRDAARILYSAHLRTSTKEHDHVFALANIFPKVMNEITIDYQQDIQELMTRFYGALAKTDLTILCFRSHDGYKELCQTSSSYDADKNIYKLNYKVPIQEFDLPSWTGVNGEHFLQHHFSTSFKNYTIGGRVMKVICSGITNNHQGIDLSFLESITWEDIPPLPQTEMKEDCDWILALVVRTPGSTDDKFVKCYEACGTEGRLNPCVEEIDIKKLKTLSHFVPVKENLQWISTKSETVFTDIDPTWPTEDFNDFDQYVLLNGIEFKFSGTEDLFSCYPVIKKDEGHYKALGICFVDGDDHFLNDMTYEEQTFEIH